LAAAQQTTARPIPRRALAVRLKDNEAVLLEAYRAIGSAAGEGHTVTLAAEWLLDNYHLVEEQIREIRDDLPSGYYRQLPKLADRILGVNGHTAEPVASVLQRYEQTPLLEAFAVQLVQRLRDQDPNLVPALAWLERRLTAQGTTADEIVRDQHQRQGATNVTT